MLRFLSPITLMSVALLLQLGLLQVGTAHAEAETWNIDTAHSSASFAVNHLMVSTVRGSMSELQGTLMLDEKKMSESKIEASINVETVNTGNKKRDDHLKSPDFFDVKKFPRITFSSTKIKGSKSKFKVEGNLTIHGVTKPVTLQVSKFSKPVQNPFAPGMSRGLRAETKIDRKDFGLVWNKTLDAGGVAVGDEVEITLDIELYQEPKAAAAAPAEGAAAAAASITKPTEAAKQPAKPVAAPKK